ncbi:MAG TPA: GNAT family N-acetyltransferase [Vicinamibacterales bacterium]|nr:GNAT family N-acetyltransferase [Vicinamibacterales bacterium]
MLIRRAAADDADALSDLAHRAKAHWGYPAHWMREWDAQLTIIPGYLDLHDVWVAEEDGAVVGMCALEDRGDRCNLEHVWVEPARHGRGVGRALVLHALTEARRRSVSAVELLSDPFASGFYERLGARRIGEVPAPMPGARDRTLPKFEFVLAPRPT